MDQLLRAQRSVEAVLTKNANKYSKEFMEGMDLVKGVESDLEKSKEIVSCTKEFYQFMQAKVVKSSMEIIQLHRQRKRLIICRKVLVDIFKRFQTAIKEINELLLKAEYFDALNLIDKALEDLDAISDPNNMNAIQNIKQKLKVKRQLIADKTSQGMGDTIVNFNPTLYSKCLKTFKVKAGEKSDPRMAGRKQGSRTKILFEVIILS